MTLIGAAVLGAFLRAGAAGEGQEDLRTLFEEYAGKRSESAEKALRDRGDAAVPFLIGVILARAPHLRKFTTVDGPQEVMGTWSQEASSLLLRIDTPLVVAEARKLAVHADREVPGRGRPFPRI